MWQTQRQERALTDIHTELNIKTKQIIDNLNLLQLANVRDSTSHGSVPGISSSSTATTSTTSSTSSTSSRSTAPGSVSPATSNLTKRSKSDVHDGPGIILANKPQESQQVSVTFKPTEIPTSRGVVGSGSVATASQSLIRRLYEDSWSLAGLFSSLSAIYQEVYRQARQRNLSIEKEESTQSHDQWLTYWISSIFWCKFFSLINFAPESLLCLCLLFSIRL